MGRSYEIGGVQQKGRYRYDLSKEQFAMNIGRPASLPNSHDNEMRMGKKFRVTQNFLLLQSTVPHYRYTYSGRKGREVCGTRGGMVISINSSHRFAEAPVGQPPHMAASHRRSGNFDSRINSVVPNPGFEDRSRRATLRPLAPTPLDRGVLRRSRGRCPAFRDTTRGQLFLGYNGFGLEILAPDSSRELVARQLSSIFPSDSARPARAHIIFFAKILVCVFGYRCYFVKQCYNHFNNRIGVAFG